MPQAVAIPLIAAGIGGGAGLIGAHMQAGAQQSAAQQQANLYNEYLKAFSGGQQNYLKYLEGLGPQVSTSATSQRGGGHEVTETAPFITPQYQTLEGAMRDIIQRRLAGPSALPAGYVENATRAINTASAGSLQAVRNLAARRGLSGVQSAALATPFETARAGDIANLQGQVPLLERQMRTEDVGLGSALTQAFGRGQRGTRDYSSWMSGTGSFTSPRPVAPYQAFLPGGPQAGTETGISPGGVTMSGLGEMLANLAGSGAFGNLFRPGISGGVPAAATPPLYTLMPGYSP